MCEFLNLLLTRGPRTQKFHAEFRKNLKNGFQRKILLVCTLLIDPVGL